MNHFTTLLIRNLLNNKHNLPEFESVLSEVFRQQLEEAVNDVLNYELEQFLGYERYKHTDEKDSRNGFKPERKIDTKYGPITIRMPRDRLGLFVSSLIPAYMRRTQVTENSIIDLFDLGFTNSEITEAVEKMFGAKVSRGTVSNITNRILSNIDSFKKRRLAKEYAVIYIDATMMPLRRDTVQKEAVHIALGIRTDGTKEIIDYSIAPNESKTNWKEMIESIRERGVERVALFCTDGLNGMEEVIISAYPMSRIQRCLLHVQRNISSKCRASDRAEITEDFKAVYTAADKNAVQDQLANFNRKWSRKYPKIIESLKSINMFTFYDFPSEIRSSIYTTNMIESYNKQLKRHFKAKEQFPTELSEEKFLVSQFERYNEKFLNRIHKGFGKVIDFWFSDSCTCTAVTGDKNYVYCRDAVNISAEIKKTGIKNLHKILDAINIKEKDMKKIIINVKNLKESKKESKDISWIWLIIIGIILSIVSMLSLYFFRSILSKIFSPKYIPVLSLYYKNIPIPAQIQYVQNNGKLYALCNAISSSCAALLFLSLGKKIYRKLFKKIRKDLTKVITFMEVLVLILTVFSFTSQVNSNSNFDDMEIKNNEKIDYNKSTNIEKESSNHVIGYIKKVDIDAGQKLITVFDAPVLVATGLKDKATKGTMDKIKMYLVYNVDKVNSFSQALTIALGVLLFVLKDYQKLFVNSRKKC